MVDRSKHQSKSLNQLKDAGEDGSKDAGRCIQDGVGSNIQVEKGWEQGVPVGGVRLWGECLGAIEDWDMI